MAELLRTLVEGCQRATRLQHEGRSSARGPVPRWLEAAADFDVTDIRPGSTQLVVEASPLKKIAAEHFGAGDFSPSISSGATALDLFHRGLEEASAGGTDSDWFDVPLLKTFGNLRRVLDYGFEEIEFDMGRRLTIGADALETIRALRTRVPDQRHVRVSGKLEQIQHSDRRFVLLVGEEPLRGVADDGISLEQLASMFGQFVTVTGEAIFRPSGRVLRIEASSFEVAAADVQVWAKVPRPLFSPAVSSPRNLAKQSPTTGLAAIFGRWPGDESDEELMAALEVSS